MPPRVPFYDSCHMRLPSLPCLPHSDFLLIFISSTTPFHNSTPSTCRIVAILRLDNWIKSFLKGQKAFEIRLSSDETKYNDILPFGTRQTTNMSLTNCRFYEEKYPEVESFVMVNVKQVSQMQLEKTPLSH